MLVCSLRPIHGAALVAAWHWRAGRRPTRAPALGPPSPSSERADDVSNGALSSYAQRVRPGTTIAIAALLVCIFGAAIVQFLFLAH